MYEKSMENFHRVIKEDRDLTVEYVPYENASMKVFVFKVQKPVGNLIVFGG